MGMRKVLLGTLLGLVLLAACGPANTIPSSPSPSSILTFTPIPTLTATPQIVPATTVPSPTVEAATLAPYAVHVSVENANLRRGPGTIFPVSRLLAKGTRVQVLGHAPGEQWLYVQTDEGVPGWILYWLVDDGENASRTPLIQPQGVQTITGKIVDRAGVPISGIGFAVTNGAGPTAPRTDATSDSTGRFYAFLPEDATGEWYVSFVSVACTSNTMDASCNCLGACGKADPASVSITLPHEGELEFVWK